MGAIDCFTTLCFTTIKNRYRCLLCVLCVFLFTGPLKAQYKKNIDSLLIAIRTVDNDTSKVHLYESLSLNYAQTRKETGVARAYADSMVMLSRQLNYEKGVKLAHFNYGLISSYETKYEETIGHMELFVDYFEDDWQHPLLAKAYRHIGIAHSRLGNYLTSLEAYEKTLRLAESNGDWYEYAAALNSIGVTYYITERFDKSIESLERVIAFADTSEVTQELAYTLLNLGRSYFKLQQNDKALEAFNRSLDISRKFDNKLAIAGNLTNIAFIHAHNNEYEKALQLNLEALGIRKKLPQKNFIVVSLLNVGRNYRQLGQYKLSEEYLLEALSIAEETGMNLLISNAYKDVSDLYADMGDYSKAFEYKKLHHDKKDSIFAEKQLKQISELQTRYETSEKEKQIEVLAKEKELQQSELQKQSFLKTAFIVGFVLMSFLVVLIYYIFRHRVKTQKQLAAKNSALEESNQAIKEQNAEINQQNDKIELLLKEIHHRVKNNLQVISSLLNLQTADMEDPKALDIMMESKNRVNSMALIHQKLYQGENLASVEMKDYLHALGQIIRDSFGRTSKEVRIHCEMEELELDVDTAIPLGLMVNELITNSLKYSFPDGLKGDIFISLKKDSDGLLHLKISDNGLGAEPIYEDSPKKSTGFGTQLVHLLTLQMNGKVIQNYESGAFVEIELGQMNAT